MNNGGQSGGGVPFGPNVVIESGTYGNCVLCGLTLNHGRYPQLLPCLHSICQACLPPVNPGLQKDLSISPACPSCDMPFNILEVKDNLFIKNSSNDLWTGNVQCTCCEGFVASGWCVECGEALCSECVSAHRRVKVTKDHTIRLQRPTGVSAPTVFCPTHKHEPIKLFCLTCDQLTCRDCQLMDHRNHSFQFLHEAMVSQKEQLQSLVQRVRQQRVAVKQSLLDMDGRLLDITQLKSKLRESLKRMLFATVQLLKSRATSLYNNIETMCNAEVAGIETRQSALNKLGQRQDYVADFAEKALNVDDFFALLSYKGQIGSQLQHLLTQSTEPPGTMLKLQLVITDDFKKQIASFGKLLGDIVPFDQSHVSQDNPLENQERPNAPSGQTSSSAPNMSIHSVPPPHNPVIQPPRSSYTAPSNPLSQPSTSQPSTSREPPPYRSLPVHTPSSLPLSHPVTPQPCPSTLAPSHPSLNIHNPPFCIPPNPAQPSLVPALHVRSPLVPTNPAQPSLVPALHVRSPLVPTNPAQPSLVPKLHVQSPLVPTNHAQLSPVQPPTSPSLQPLIEATPRLYGMFKATPPPGRSRRLKDGKSWTFHSYSPVEICHPPSGSSSPAAVAQHQKRKFPKSQLLWILHQPPSVNPIPVLPVKALADSPCDRSLPPTGLADPDPNSQARENEPTSTVTELETDTGADSAMELEVPSAWADRKAAACSDSTSSDLPFTGTLSTERTSNHLSHSVLTHTHHPKEETDTDPNSKPSSVGRTHTAPHNNKKIAYDQQHEDAIRSLHRRVNSWRTELPTRIRVLLEGPSPLPTRTGSVVATEMPTRQSNTTQPPSLTNSNNVNNSRSWQPRVLMFRLPISTPTPGCSLPQFLLVQGASKDEIILQEIAEDHQSHGDDITPLESDSLLWTKALSSPESPPLLQYVTCAACHTVGGSLYCVECGRGYHQDCHIPPIGPSFWEEWKCSLCQDLADNTDPYSDNRHRTMCLSLADQRKCEHLLLFLRCENDRNILCSTAEPPSDSICLDFIHGRLLQHRSPPYRTPSEFVSDVWVLFDTMLMNSKDQELVVKLRGSFQSKLGEVFGTTLHPSLLSHPNGSWTETGEPGEPTAEESLKRIRELLNMTKVPKAKKRHSQVRVETDENETKMKKMKKDAD
ncbi:E3 ubiquitin-protein ligase TRIM33 [Oncorhynchus keta]|uniref:E3 ubiquitin-protein ligase TRIM33 n=1 Tax=Oncorhynchus keta TaxID=8018 RepID=UPI0015FAAB37|nr:E3 ubiquitin-protein ligase TRIM33 [Oncorhynchus keta]XP_035607178.1 E3 ubiquitin-protein ligase TRIM33 [Oncorhynchus keta]